MIHNIESLFTAVFLFLEFILIKVIGFREYTVLHNLNTGILGYNTTEGTIQYMSMFLCSLVVILCRYRLSNVPVHPQICINQTHTNSESE
jgi:hypothetical protein